VQHAIAVRFAERYVCSHDDVTDLCWRWYAAITSRLRSSQTFPKVHTRTQRYSSFIQYGLNHYQ